MGILIFLESNLIEIVKVISVEQWQTEAHVIGVSYICCYPRQNWLVGLHLLLSRVEPDPKHRLMEKDSRLR